jgi:hypothetical protein
VNTLPKKSSTVFLYSREYNLLNRQLVGPREHADGNRETTVRRPDMKKNLLAITFIAFPLSAKTTRLRNYGCIAIVLLAGCTSTQVRWDATRMREEVMVYYNDQIMDNLIRAKNDVPFVHVDITLLTSQGASQITGTVGAGETRANLNASKSMVGVLGTISNAVTRPFTYSVSPQQTETLGITTAPALGNQAVLKAWPPEPSQSTSPKPSPDGNWEETKKTIVDGKTTTEKAPKKPETVTIYEAYKTFADKNVRRNPVHPKDGDFVLGTLRWKDGNYYYVDDKVAYYNFCTRLFTKAQTSASSLQAQLQQIQGQAALQ